jgi:hypothetical protein
VPLRRRRQNKFSEQFLLPSRPDLLCSMRRLAEHTRCCCGAVRRRTERSRGGARCMWRPGSGGDHGPFPLRAVGMLEGELSEVVLWRDLWGDRDPVATTRKTKTVVQSFFSQANIGLTVDGLPSVGPSGGHRWFSRRRTRDSARAVGLARKLLWFGSSVVPCRSGCKNVGYIWKQ